ncbi:hypothetical protein QU39_00090, partial [Staphylococcus aureus]
DLGRVEDVEVDILAPGDVAALAQKVGDRRLDLGAVIIGIGADQHQAQVGIAGEAALHLLDRHDDDIVLVSAKPGLAARLQHADHVARDAVDTDSSPHRAAAAEQVGPDRRADDAHRLARLFLRPRPVAALDQRPG